MVEYDKYHFKSKEKPKYVKKKPVIVQGVEIKAKNKNVKGVALENKLAQQKSTCVDCDFKKSTFLKQVKNKKQFSQITKTCIFIVKNVKNTQVTNSLFFFKISYLFD